MESTTLEMEPTTTFQHFTLFTDYDIHLFRAGKHFKLYEKLGSHVVKHGGTEGTYFAVWAPNAKSISVIGNFNNWNNSSHHLHARWDESGIWEGFFPDIKHGEIYKYAIQSTTGDYLEKADPFARYYEMPPQTASVVWEPHYEWKDQKWLERRKSLAGKPQPYSVYEVHLGSWKKKYEDNNRSLNYPEFAQELVQYVKDLGFTHVEFLPVMEHPFYGSWGYQLTGYFAPTSRYGSPSDFMYLVDCFHQAGIGVILDWVPSHFPGDAHGLYKFDGTHLFEHADPRLGFHPDWSSYIFNYGRNEVRAFLISNALFWLEQYHIDGLRVDAVASMLYLDYSRKAGEWIPNKYGGNENLEAIAFLKEFNEVVYANYPDTITVAEESTSWSGVSRPTFLGGLGFGQKWMMGWMHDTLSYFKTDPIHRKYHQNDITFSVMYAFTENFMLPLSHDEVVHGKGSLLGRMPGDDWRRFANLRLLFSYMFTHPGTKLLFMGGEFGQAMEWSHDRGLDWNLLQHPLHAGVQTLIKDLNTFYKAEKALYQYAFEAKGFQWIDYSDRENSVIAYQRMADDKEDVLVIVCNFTPEVRYHYRVGVPYRGMWKEAFNSDNSRYGGSDVLNAGLLSTSPVKYHGGDYSISLTLPPLAVSVLKLEKEITEFDLQEKGT
ncbi:1,4-alpha-glucan branching protein GlgB [Chryseosolibacter indicus]|uniref:1,4-alpha-glucan branching enzyme GlgB n=1 Tax=Chryseosolibacter indicus TaxID=2782351 RepID=A0ABS5VLT6_9BACT|nr:1,4-alpha-glucan branching protein GlgB [Chryseosolibacter indicus]MBT1701819.1 1,4-alpha-glucan branching protein GlgB [Chryseosolibacter indicus]